MNPENQNPKHFLNYIFEYICPKNPWQTKRLLLCRHGFDRKLCQYLPDQDYTLLQLLQILVTSQVILPRHQNKYKKSLFKFYNLLYPYSIGTSSLTLP